MAIGVRHSGDDELLHMVEHHVNVDGLSVQRPFVGEHLHLIDEIPDAVGFLADQLCQGAIITVERGFQQLCGTPDAGQAGS